MEKISTVEGENEVSDLMSALFRVKLADSVNSSYTRLLHGVHDIFSYVFIYEMVILELLFRSHSEKCAMCVCVCTRYAVR